MSKFGAYREKMEAAGLSEAAILSFERNFQSLCEDSAGIIPEESISPVSNLLEFDSFCAEEEGFSADLLAKTVVIKLNGGLGTSMGLQKAKSLLAVRDGANFLDLIVNQILHLRRHTGAKVKFLLMNSFSTSEDTLNQLKDYAERGLENPSELELMQNQVPKIDKETLLPAENPQNSAMEWCPPGHGDLYAALSGSGMLDKLLAEGVTYAFVSNADNLGAVLDPRLLSFFVNSGKSFIMEATCRTAADKKGGHLALRNEDGQLLLREVAQTEDSDLESFQDIDKYRYFNTNSLWIRLDKLKQVLEECGGIMPLPMIKNEKTIDPRDPSSAPVYQLEVAMGAAIECFADADAICVPRSRFAPVKTSADLLGLRSDAYTVNAEGRVCLVPERAGQAPVVRLSEEYKLVDSLEGLGVPSLKEADKLTVVGPIRFAEGVRIKGDVKILNKSEKTKWLGAGTYQDETVEL